MTASPGFAMEKRPKTHIQPLPRSKEELLELIKRALETPEVEEIRITPTDFAVRRVVFDNEDAFPAGKKSEDDFDPEFLLTRINLEELPNDYIDAHPYHKLLEACRRLSSESLSPVTLISPDGGWLSAFLGLDDQRPSEIFGIKVLYTQSPNHQEKFVLVGSPSSFITDARTGILIDMGA